MAESQTILTYIYIPTVGNDPKPWRSYSPRKLYTMYGGEPNHIGYYTTEEEAENCWGKNYVKMEMTNIGTDKPRIRVKAGRNQKPNHHD